MASEFFQVRKLLWDELLQHSKPSELDELQTAIGSTVIAENEALKKELAVLVEILSEFQQQNDQIRDALIKRQRVPEPPGRPLLLEKLKLLARDLQSEAKSFLIQSRKEEEIFEYVLTATGPSNSFDSECCSTPRMPNVKVLPVQAGHDTVIPLRPGTSNGVRPITAGSQRPVSRGSTISISSTPALLESLEVQSRLNIEEIDSIKEDLQVALQEERLLLLEDIEFVQNCLEMEKDLIDDDRRKVSSLKPPPSLNDLHEFHKKLERTLRDQHEKEQVEIIFSKTSDSYSARRKSSGLSLVRCNLLPGEEHDPLSQPSLPSLHLPSSSCLSRSGSATKVLKIRHVVQEIRDEPFFS